MGSINNEDEFCWLSSSHGAEGPDDDALKSAFKFSSTQVSPLKSISDNMDLNENTEGLPIHDCDKKASSFDKNLRTEMDVDRDAVPTSLSTFDESDMKSGSIDDLMPKQKVGYIYICMYVYTHTFLRDSYFNLDSAFLNLDTHSSNLCGFIPNHTHRDIYIPTK